VLEQRAFASREVLETRRGVCRLGPSLAKGLARHAPELRSAVAPHAEQLVRTLLRSAKAATPLTRDNHRAAGKGTVLKLGPSGRNRNVR
jgi:hypothetical protein